MVGSDLVERCCLSSTKDFALELVVVAAVDAVVAFEVVAEVVGPAGCLVYRDVDPESLQQGSYSKVDFELIDDKP